MAVRNQFNAGTVDDPLGLNSDPLGAGKAGSTFGIPPPPPAPARNPYETNSNVTAGGTPTIPASAFAIDPTLMNSGGQGVTPGGNPSAGGSTQVTKQRITQPDQPDLGTGTGGGTTTGTGTGTGTGTTGLTNVPLDTSWALVTNGLPAQGPSLYQAFRSGLSGEEAVNWANSATPGGGYAYRADTGTYSVPGGGYVGKNAQGNYFYAPGDSGGPAPTGPGPAALDTGAGTAFDPNASATDQALLDLINSGTTPMGGKVQKALLDIIDKGGVAPDTTPQLIAAREAEANAETGQLADARSQLASQGTMSEPGVVQGPSQEAVGQVQRLIAPSYSGAVSTIEQNAAQLKQQSLMTALTTATGMSEANAQTILSAIGTGTQRTTALANISLSLLADNIDWNKFLATNGLNQAQLQEQIRNNNFQYVLGWIHEYVLQGGQLNLGAAGSTG